jgi:hypothetical protein
MSCIIRVQPQRFDIQALPSPKSQHSSSFLADSELPSISEQRGSFAPPAPTYVVQNEALLSDPLQKALSLDDG